MGKLRNCISLLLIAAVFIFSPFYVTTIGWTFRRFLKQQAIKLGDLTGNQGLGVNLKRSLNTLTENITGKPIAKKEKTAMSKNLKEKEMEILRLQSELKKFKDQKKQAVMWRMYDSSNAAQLDRIMGYVAQVNHRVDCWFAFDVHAKDIEKAVLYDLEKRCKKAGCYTFFYSASSLFEVFPKLESNLGVLGTSMRKVTWSQHGEAVGVWYSLYPDYEYTWIIEADVGFSGNFNVFLDAFQDEDSDYIADLFHPNARWDKKNKHTQEYAEMARLSSNVTERWRTWEFLTRISKRLLQKSQEFMLAGATAWSEKFYANICVRDVFPGCSNSRVDSKIKYGARKNYFWNANVSCSTWKGILEDPARKNRLFHALKKC